MKKSVDLLWTLIFSCFLLAFVGGNAYFLFAQQPECPDRGVTDGACTSCDQEYLSTYPTPTCTVKAGCSGEGNKLDGANIGITYKKDKKAVNAGFVVSCLYVVLCESYKENGVTACRKKPVKILQQAPYYEEKSC